MALGCLAALTLRTDMADLLTPDGVAEDAVQRRVLQKQQTGELPFDVWSKHAKPTSGWSSGSWRGWLATAGQQQSGLPGSQDPNASWQVLLRGHLLREEGDRDTTYKDIGGNRTVGIGFNLDRPGGVDTLRSVLGLSADQARDVYNGKTALSRKQRDRLYDADIASLDQSLTGMVGRQLPDPQRAALLSLMFNAGAKGVEKSGIPVLVRDGKLREALTAIRGFNTLNGKLARRRASEARLFAGADASDLQ